jgi:sugar/nucleoside kinase (ribokinase family)
MNLIIVGSIAIDNIETPFDKREESFGGSAIFSSIAASKFTPTGIIGVVGDDYPNEICDLLQKNGINLKGLEKVPGETFRWTGIYKQFGRAETLDTQLNVFADFKPLIPTEYKDAEYVLLGNIHPQLQLDVIRQIPNAKVIGADTMNFWIDSTPKLLGEVIQKVTILFINEDEIKQFTNKSNIYDAGDEILKLGPKYVIIKRGEYGAIAYGNDINFNVPVYPIRNVFDTTGAGDSFAGGFMGCIANMGMFDDESIKKAMIFGTVTASFNIESFSFDKLLETDIKGINERIAYIVKSISF